MNSLEKSHKIPLKIKINQILKKCGYPKCHNFLEKLNLFNLKVIYYQKSNPYINQKIKESKHFYNGKPKDESIHYVNTTPFAVNYDLISQEFLKNLTKDEFRKIQHDKEYYLREKDLIENLTIFKHDSLFQILTKEEKGIKPNKINLKKNLKKLQILISQNNNDEYEKDNNILNQIKEGIKTERKKDFMIYLKNINREKGLQKINRDLLNDYQKIDKIQSKSRNNYQKLKNNNTLLITQQDYLINSTNDINSSDNSRKIYKTMENRIPKIKMNLNLKHKIHQSDIKKQRKIMAQNILIGNYMNEISDRIKISYLSKKDKNEVNDNKKRKPIHLPSLSVNLPQKIYL